jgi:hypothetical protein
MIRLSGQINVGTGPLSQSGLFAFLGLDCPRITFGEDG